jgi:anti-sigma regulatory factor (Ser/Thr protein kinase)
MFVTCLYAVIEPSSGGVRYANAGHNLPYLRSGRGVSELRATGMPLGLLPGMSYDEHEACIDPGDRLVLYSDGLIEAHDGQAAMFGFPRVMGLLGAAPVSRDLIDLLLTELHRFTGSAWEQEDDITLVTIERSPHHLGIPSPDRRETVQILTSFELASTPGNERAAMARVMKAVTHLDLPEEKAERLRTAVSEGVMNAIEHGNHNNPEIPVGVSASLEGSDLVIRIVDRGSAIVPVAPQPDLDLKLAGLQAPRGWGLFLIRNMVDHMRQSLENGLHTIELVLNLSEEGSSDASSDI